MRQFLNDHPQLVYSMIGTLVIVSMSFAYLKAGVAQCQEDVKRLETKFENHCAKQDQLSSVNSDRVRAVEQTVAVTAERLNSIDNRLTRQQDQLDAIQKTNTETQQMLHQIIINQAKGDK